MDHRFLITQNLEDATCTQLTLLPLLLVRRLRSIRMPNQESLDTETTDVAGRVCIAQNRDERVEIRLQCLAALDGEVDFVKDCAKRGPATGLACQAKGIKTWAVRVVDMIRDLLQRLEW